MDIRFEQPGDASAIDAVQQAAFPHPEEARIVELLRADGDLTISIVAEIDGRCVGHVALSPIRLAGQPTAGLGLGPIGVVPECQGQSVGSQLMQAALAASAQAGYEWIILLGNPRYYQRFGFTPASAYGLTNIYDNSDAFQIVILPGGSAPASGGLIEYAPAFQNAGA